ncbi:GNAT family N-acetyltransferase, partial [Phytohabitans kaempferiae]
MVIRFELDPALTPALREEIVSLWTEVTNAGGAVGFVEPVSRDDVLPMAAAAFTDIAEGADRLLAGFEGERLVAMLIFVDNRFALKDHWCTLKRVMVHPDLQGRGYGVALIGAPLFRSIRSWVGRTG